MLLVVEEFVFVAIGGFGDDDDDDKAGGSAAAGVWMETTTDVGTGGRRVG